MKFANVTTALSKLTGKTGLAVKAHSPEILLVMGIGGIVASTVMACRSTLKAEGVLDEHKEKVGKINEVWQKVEDGEIDADRYTEKEHQKDLTVIYAQTTVNFIKLYGPAVTLGIASIACLVSSHGIMKKRNVALVAAYKAIEEGFTAYRKRVVEEYGEEKDYMFSHGLHEVEVENAAYTDDDGTKHKATKEKVLVATDPKMPSPYAKFFDESCKQWTKSADYNLCFLRGQQQFFNDLLIRRGNVFLNEVYDALGIERTQAGSVVGWMISENGDNYIDFGFYDGDSERARAFVNGNERSVLLDFNVDGVIYDRFTKEKV
jgi:hypothetical protein